MTPWNHRLEYRALCFVVKICRGLSPASVVRLGRFLGLFSYYLVPIRKKTALNNLALAFPEKTPGERKRILRRTFANFGQTFFEFLRTPFRSKSELADRVLFVNRSLLFEADRDGKGALLLTGHFGNWEIMAAAIASLGFPIMAIGKRQKNRLVDRLINDFRRSQNIETIPLGMSVRQFLRALRENKFVALLADQDAHREGVFVDFFGIPSATAPGVAQLALKTGAPIIFGTCTLLPKGRYRVLLETVPADDLDPRDENSIVELTQRHARLLESHIRRHPDHWFWMHRRWKTKPPGQSG